MSWQDSLRVASFRRIAFQVTAHGAEGGRRVPVYEAPGVDEPILDDLGARPRRFTLTGFLVGRDYHLQRDRLLEALQTAGPGELVHPYLGRMLAACDSFNLSETAADGGTCRFDLAFVRANPTRAPITRGDTGGATRSSAAALHDAAEEAFAAALDLGPRADAAQEAAASSFERAAAALDLIQLRGAVDKVAAWKDKLRTLTDEALERLRSPGAFSADVRDLVETLPKVYGVRGDLWRVLLGLARTENARPAPLISGGSAADAGDRALSDLLARLFAGQAASEAVALTWPTYDDAEAARATLVALLEELRGRAGDREFGALMDLQASLVAGLPPEGVDLPRLSSVTLLRSIPATVLAYRVFGNTTREADVIARSHARNPLFLPAGVPIPIVLDP